MGFIIVGIIFLALGFFLFIKGVVGMQRRDKRYNKGIKRKFNIRSLVYFVLGIVCFYAATKLLLVV